MRVNNVRFRKTAYREGRKSPYQVRWAVGRKPFTQSFLTSALAEHFRNNLMSAARNGESFSDENGLPPEMQPKSEQPEEAPVTWLAFARRYADMMWPESAANSRRNTASSLARITLMLLTDELGMPPRKELRTALRRWALRPAKVCGEVPAEARELLDWVAARSRPMSDLQDLDLLRRVLHQLGQKLNGERARPNSVQRHRAVLHHLLAYAVECQVLTENPMGRLTTRAPVITRAIDPRVVVNPRQARDLLIAVTYVGEWEHHRGRLLMPFFACLYFGALRPEEAVRLRRADCALPKEGPGTLWLSGSAPRAGRAWTDSGEKHDDRGLKHRAPDETRDVPVSPELVRILQRYLEDFGTAEDGRLFRSPSGEILDSTRYLDVWHKARQLALPPHLAATPLARRPYDLRHAALSTWLNAGVSPAEVARRAGNSVPVLLQTYARCIHGEQAEATRRIIASLGDDTRVL